MLIAALVLFFGSMYLSIQKGTEFFPDMESTQATLTVTTDSGTPLEETAEKSDEVIQKIEDIEILKPLELWQVVLQYHYLEVPRPIR